MILNNASLVPGAGLEAARGSLPRILRFLKAIEIEHFSAPCRPLVAITRQGAQPATSPSSPYDGFSLLIDSAGPTRDAALQLERSEGALEHSIIGGDAAAVIREYQIELVHPFLFAP